MTDVTAVACPTCRALKGESCKTVIIGSGDYHNERVNRADGWDAAVAGMRKKAKAAADAKKKRGPTVEPIGSDDLAGYTRAVKCPHTGCGKQPGEDCDTPRGLQFHANRRKRGETLMIRARQ